MVKLSDAFRQLKPFRALVLGDFMLDTYTTGKVQRISPEAPVAVMEVAKQESRPGGAGNVVLSLKKIGASVSALGRIGADFAGKELKRDLATADVSLLIEEIGYQTPVKNRVIADSQQLLRIDFEQKAPLQKETEERVLSLLYEAISRVEVVAFSDYGKGFLTDRILQRAIEIANELSIPTIVDPKGVNFEKYRGVSILKPNRQEAYMAAGCSMDLPIEAVSEKLLALTKTLFITRSEEGISLFSHEIPQKDFPVLSKEVKDVTGAGDTVLAILCLGVANQLSLDITAELANIGAGIAIERLGCAQVSLSELAERLLQVHVESKVFDESHLYALQQVLQNHPFSLFVIEKGEKISSALFRSIRSLREKKEGKLIIYLEHSSEEMIHVLSSMHEVDHIVVQTQNLKSLCQSISPCAIYRMKGSEPISLGAAKEVLGELLTLPK